MDVEELLAQAAAALAAGHPEGAIDLAARAWALAGDPRAAALAGHACARRGLRGDAAGWLERADGITVPAPGPDPVAPHLARADAAADPARALAAVDAALGLHPLHPGALLRRAALLDALGRPDDANAALRVAAETVCKPALDRWRARGLPALGGHRAEDAAAALDRGALDEAAACFADAADAHLRASRAPGDGPWRHAAMALANRGTCLLELGRPAEALDDLERAVELRPGHLPAWHSLGTARAQLGDLEVALRCFDRAEALDPISPDPHYNRAGALLALGRVADAIDALDVALARGYPPAQAHRRVDAERRRTEARALLGDPARPRLALQVRLGVDPTPVQRRALAAIVVDRAPYVFRRGAPRWWWTGRAALLSTPGWAVADAGRALDELERALRAIVPLDVAPSERDP